MGRLGERAERWARATRRTVAASSSLKCDAAQSVRCRPYGNPLLARDTGRPDLDPGLDAIQAERAGCHQAVGLEPVDDQPRDPARPDLADSAGLSLRSQHRTRALGRAARCRRHGTAQAGLEPGVATVAHRPGRPALQLVAPTDRRQTASNEQGDDPSETSVAAAADVALSAFHDGTLVILLSSVTRSPRRSVSVRDWRNVSMTFLHLAS